MQGNLVTSGFKKLDKWGNLILSITGIGVGSSGVAVDKSTGNFFISSGGSTSDYSLPVLLAYSASGSLLWKKDRNSLDPIYKVRYNSKNNCVYAISGNLAKIYVFNATTGASITSMTWTTNYVDFYIDDDGSMYLLQSNGTVMKYSKDLVPMWVSNTITGGLTYPGVTYGDYVYFTNNEYIHKYTRYAKYTLI